MNQLAINLISAVAISLVIGAMSKLPSQRAKALLYALPIPITIALIGSKGIGDSLNISGLMLTMLFLWGCYYLHIKLRQNILLVDVVLSVLYVALAYMMVRILHISFPAIVALFVVLWALLMFLFRTRTFTYIPGKVSQTNIWLKSLTIFVIAFLMFTAKDYLAAFVVTFPYNGVFAVYENRAGLYPQAALVTRNSLALLAFFVANYYTGHYYGDVMRYVLSWAAFGAVLFVINKLINIKVAQVAR